MRWQRLVVLLAIVVTAVVLPACASAPRESTPVKQPRPVPETTATALAPRESLYTTSVVLDPNSSLGAELEMQRLKPTEPGRNRFYARLAIRFDDKDTYWDSNGYILSAVTPWGHEDLDHGLPGVGKTKPRMLSPTGGTMWGWMPSDATAIGLVVYAGPTKQAASRGRTLLLVPTSAIPVVEEFKFPQPNLGRH